MSAAKDFSRSLENIISEWNRLKGNDGYFYEFSSIPEVDITNFPSVSFFFNVTDKGSTGELVIEFPNSWTNEVTMHSYKMDKREEVQDLQSLLDNGINYFSNGD